jgi:hypothetical protein
MIDVGLILFFAACVFAIAGATVLRNRIIRWENGVLTRMVAAVRRYRLRLENNQ